MRENRIRSIWKSGGAVVNGWLAIPSSFSAEVMAHQGWDTLTVDLQHGVTDYASAVAMFTAISTVFAFGNSSDAFIFLRTADLESSVALVPLIYFLHNVVYAALATPLGSLSDRFGRLPVLVTGYAAFGLVYVGWALATQSLPDF